MGAKNSFSFVELIAPCVVLLFVCIVILPLPQFCIDLFVGLSMVLALILLLSSFYVESSLSLSTFPSILLVATFCRLSLNISTTRLILEEGQVGSVVQGIGQLMIGNSVIIGVIIFLLINLIQLIVISKGSERVAEVSARFALDSLPGRQMSIDADLRSGLIGMSEAQKKREMLQDESRLYGALDGAMKFIKGDSMASFLIAFINLIGGSVIGVAHKKMSLVESFNHYAILTIGDGIVSQLPALLNAFAAGIVVTRVSQSKESNLAYEMISQLFQRNKVTFFCGVICVFIASIPGTPHFIFLVLGSILFFTCLLRKQHESLEGKVKLALLNEESEFKSHSIIELKLPKDFIGELTKQNTNISAVVKSIRLRLFLERGLVFSKEDIQVSQIESESLSLYVRGEKLCSKEISKDSTTSEILEEVSSLLIENSHEILDDFRLSTIFHFYGSAISDVVSTIIPDVVTHTEFCVILKSLLKEGISIQPLHKIIQTTAELVPQIGKGRLLIEEIRIALSKTIQNIFCPNGTLENVVFLRKDLENELVQAERNCDVVSANSLQEIIGITDELYSRRDSKEPAVLVVNRSARAILRDYLQACNIEIPVLAREELKGIILSKFQPELLP
jgi:type III secretion protein V